uniref:MYND-type domain-containing protein n=1 Tax=Globisporangium ultimum (strain ATCC 200006 / CBS 805.95 / DAOM BR144) TaxID=431595 RepID=K3WCK5_GLOUD
MLLEWACRGHQNLPSGPLHTQWFNADDLVFVERINGVNASLGRRPHEQSFESENDDCVELWRNPRLGRFAVAKSGIPAGKCALKATAFAVIVKQQLARRRCHWCFKTLTKKAFQCGSCKFALYCSRDCLDADEVLHAFQCRTLEGLHQYDFKKTRTSAWEDMGIDLETIRLALAVLSMEHFVQTTQPLSRLVTQTSKSSKQNEVLDQVTAFIAAGIGGIGNKSLTTAHIRQTLQRVQYNAHPLCLNGATTVGVGVFPEAAMTLNHSCLPNVVPSFDMRTRTLAFHAIEEIPLGHAVEYSYIDLLQSVARRRDILSSGFGFECACWRCEDESNKREPHTSPTGSSNMAPAAEEDLVMQQLMQLRSSETHHAQRNLFSQLFATHSHVFERNHELMFAYRMLLMKNAAAGGDWKMVIAEAETLIDMWKSQRLPEIYPTLETLHLQIQIAAEKAGLTAKATQVRQQVMNIRRVCGYSDES